MQIYNRTTTDVAAATRRDRLEDVYRIVSDVNKVLGLNSMADSRLEWFGKVPLGYWILIASFIVLSLCFYLARILYGDVGMITRSRLALRRKHSSAVV